MKTTAEQQARDMLDRMGIPDAQEFTAGDVVELANLISEIGRLRKALSEAIEMIQDWGGYASEYFQQKHDLPGQVAKLRGYLDGQPEPTAPHFDQAEFDAMTAKGTKAWAGVESAADWVEEIRGNEPSELQPEASKADPEPWEVARDYVLSANEYMGVYYTGILPRITHHIAESPYHDPIGSGTSIPTAWLEAALNIAKGRVLEQYPDAIEHIFDGGATIRDNKTGNYFALGTGPTEALAWIDAAKRLEGKP